MQSPQSRDAVSRHIQQQNYLQKQILLWLAFVAASQKLAKLSLSANSLQLLRKSA